MKSDQDILSSILKTTQMGQVGIRSVLPKSTGAEFRIALQSQLREYDSIETEAHNIAREHRWELPELHPGVRAMAGMMTRMMLTGNRSDSKIADMMIQGNTRGMTKGLKNLHQYKPGDRKITSLSQKLLDRETENIKQMKPFL